MKFSVGVIGVVIIAVAYGLLLRPVPVVERNDYESELKSSAESLNLAQALGRYKQPLRAFEFPVHDEDYFSPLRHFYQTKRWHYSSVNTDNYFLAFAIVHVGYASTTFIYLVDKQSRELFEYGTIRPLGVGVSVAPSSIEGCSSSGGQVRVCYDAQLQAWKVSMDATLASAKADTGMKSSVDVKGEFVIAQPAESLALVMPLEPTKVGYTHKLAGSDAKGTLEIDGTVHDFENGYAAIDWTKSLARRLTVWKWVSLSTAAKQSVNGKDRSVALGINFSMDVYDLDGISQENAIWIDGRVFVVGRVDVSAPEGEDAKHKEMWNITTPASFACDVSDLECEYISLRFKPTGARSENVDLSPLIKSVFVQPVGTMTGVVKVRGRFSHLYHSE